MSSPLPPSDAGDPIRLAQAEQAVRNPATTAEQLAQIATVYPQLHAAIADHPNSYEALRVWIAQQTQPESPATGTGPISSTADNTRAANQTSIQLNTGSTSRLNSSPSLPHANETSTSPVSGRSGFFARLLATKQRVILVSTIAAVVVLVVGGGITWVVVVGSHPKPAAVATHSPKPAPSYTPPVDDTPSETPTPTPSGDAGVPDGTEVALPVVPSQITNRANGGWFQVGDVMGAWGTNPSNVANDSGTVFPGLWLWVPGMPSAQVCSNLTAGVGLNTAMSEWFVPGGTVSSTHPMVVMLYHYVTPADGLTPRTGKLAVAVIDPRNCQIVSSKPINLSGVDVSTTGTMSDNISYIGSAGDTVAFSVSGAAFAVNAATAAIAWQLPVPPGDNSRNAIGTGPSSQGFFMYGATTSSCATVPENIYSVATGKVVWNDPVLNGSSCSDAFYSTFSNMAVLSPGVFLLDHRYSGTDPVPWNNELMVVNTNTNQVTAVSQMSGWNSFMATSTGQVMVKLSTNGNGLQYIDSKGAFHQILPGSQTQALNLQLNGLAAGNLYTTTTDQQVVFNLQGQGIRSWSNWVPTLDMQYMTNWQLWSNYNASNGSQGEPSSGLVLVMRKGSDGEPQTDPQADLNQVSPAPNAGN